MQIEPTWWIAVIEVPVVAALFRMMYSLRVCTRINPLLRLGLCHEPA
jgi:hypothetical protein